MKKFASLFVLFLMITAQLAAQLIISDPPFPNENDEVSIVFNAAEGNAGLAGYTGDVYVHTGVITDQSTSTSDWKYVKTEWGQNTPETKLTSLGDDLYELVINPSVKEYYGVPEEESIVSMAFVFRSEAEVGGAWLEGKNQDGSDIFINMYSGGLNVQFINPTQKYSLVEINETVNLFAQSLNADSLFLFVNGELKAQTDEDELSYEYLPTAQQNYIAVIQAKNAAEEAFDTVQFFVRPDVPVAELPEGIHDGINYLSPTSVTLVLTAPQKDFVFVIGSFNDWAFSNENYMNKTPDGTQFWVQLNNLNPEKEYAYQFYVDGLLKIGDPYSEKILDPWNDRYIPENVYPDLIPYPEGKTTGIVSVLKSGREEFPWEDEEFQMPWASQLVVYELLIRDFTEDHSYESVINKLDYLEQLGINAIELMPVIEFDGNDSWGYGPSYFFAADKYYGPADQLKSLINECHKRGIVVIMDLVLNHATGNCPLAQLYWDDANNQTAANNPWFNVIAPHPLSVFHDLNHSSTYTQNYVKRVLEYWLQDYHFDGYRLDLSKGITQTQTSDIGAWSEYDYSRVENLKRIGNQCWSAKEGSYVILEHFANNDEEKELSNNGLMLWGNMDKPYAEASMGYNGSASDLSWGYYGNRGWSQPNLVTFMESHDEERQMYKNETYGNCSNTNYCITDTSIALQRSALAAAFLLTIPGPKMIWQFGETGYDYSINWPCMTEDCRTAAKPPRWDYLENPNRKALYDVYSKLLALRKQYDLFQSPYTTVEMDVQNEERRIKLTNSGLEMGEAIIIGNFGTSGRDVTPYYHHTGTWFDAFTGEAQQVNSTSDTYYLGAGEFKIFTPTKSGTWVNLQYPGEYTALACESFDVYAQIFIGSRTNKAGRAEGVKCWIGYSKMDNEPWRDNWEWHEAAYNGDRSASGLALANDEYVLTFGSMDPGTYYYASRFSIDDAPYIYGGFPSDGVSTGGAWDGETNISGILTVEQSNTRRWYVSTSGSSTGNGTIENPMNSIQAAIDQSSHCDTILVLDGQYNEDIYMKGKNVLLASEYILDGDAAHIQETIIRGSGTQSVVRILDGENHACQIIGLSITNGNTSGEWPNNSGGGIQVFGSSPILSNLMIYNNTSGDCGGGIFFHDGGNAILQNSIIEQNTAGCAAAIGVNASTCRIRNCTINSNVGNWGRAMSVWENANCQIINSSIKNQTTENEAGQPLLYCDASSILQITNTEVYNNKADKILDLNGAFIIENMSLSENLGNIGSSNPEISLLPATSSLVSNSILRKTALTSNEMINIEYSNIQGYSGGNGNIDAEPGFVDAPSGNLRLVATSLCVDAGNPAAKHRKYTDLAGNTRVWDGNGSGTAIIDMGAYEFGAPEYINIGNDTSICAGDSIILDAGSGYLSYEWNDGLSTERFLTIYSTGTYSVRAEKSDGSYAFGSRMVEVLPSPQPELPAELWFCNGSEAELNAGEGFASYEWSNGFDGQTLTTNQEGLYSVIVESFKGCKSEAVSCQVYKSSPLVDLGGDTALCKEKTLVLDAGNQGSTYLWSTGATSRTISLNSGGIVTSMNIQVKITNEHLCVAEDEIIVEFKDCTGIEENDASKFILLLPNPAHDQVLVRLRNSVSVSGISEIYLMDLSGKTLLQQYAGNVNELRLNIENVASGVYVLKVVDNSGKQYFLKLIVQ